MYGNPDIFFFKMIKIDRYNIDKKFHIPLGSEH